MRDISRTADRPAFCTAPSAAWARAGSRSSSSSAAAAWTTMIDTACATTSCSSLAIRARSAATASAARAPSRAAASRASRPARSACSRSRRTTAPGVNTQPRTSQAKSTSVAPPSSRPAMKSIEAAAHHSPSVASPQERGRYAPAEYVPTAMATTTAALFSGCRSRAAEATLASRYAAGTAAGATRRTSRARIGTSSRAVEAAPIPGSCPKPTSSSTTSAATSTMSNRYRRTRVPTTGR